MLSFNAISCNAISCNALSFNALSFNALSLNMLFRNMLFLNAPSPTAPSLNTLFIDNALFLKNLQGKIMVGEVIQCLPGERQADATG